MERLFRISGRTLDRVASFLEDKPLYPLTAFVVIYAVTALAHSVRFFWYDELFTYYVARLPNFSTIWAAMLDGLDFNPPLLYVLIRWSHRLFGYSPLATRVPSMLAFLVMSFCILVFVRRRCGFLYGFAAMWIPLITFAFNYASEARPYALVLAFCTLALVFWQSATEGSRRTFSLIGFSLALAGALLSHCYAMLILAPFGLAELVRFSRTRKPDWPLWAAFLAPLSCLLLYVPMLQNIKGYVMNSVSFHPALSLAPRFYSFLLDQSPGGFGLFGWNQAVWPLLLALTIIALAKRESPAPAGDTAARVKPPVHEIVCLVALTLLPFFGQALASTITHSFIDRYAMPAVIGITCLVPLLAASAAGGNRRTALTLVALFSMWFVVSFGIWFASLFEHHPYDLPVLKFASLPKELPIVISDPLLFLETNYKEPPEIAGRLRFVTERSSALQYTGTDLFDRGYYTMERWLPIKGKVFEFADFLAANKHFLIYGPFVNPEDWLIRRIAAGGFDIRYLGEYNGRSDSILLDVTVRETPKNMELTGPAANRAPSRQQAALTGTF